MVSFDKEYRNGEITVYWKPGKCQHSAKCFRSLPQVFNPAERPWINIEGAPSEQIVATVTNCPSGALSYLKNEDIDK